MRSGLKPDGARETFALLRVIVLQTDLQLLRLQKLPASLFQGIVGDFAAHGACATIIGEK